MTSNDTMQFIRTLLDDGRDWFPTTAEVIRAVNEAQIAKLNEYYKMHDERALRPLYRQTARFSSGALVGDTVGGIVYQVMFPRALKILATGQSPEAQGVHADYVPEELYFNYEAPGVAAGTTFPRTARYTITRAYDAFYLDTETYCYFTSGGNNTIAPQAILWYIVYPLPFTFDKILLTGTPLQVPQEYHPEICMYAAELLNDMDVNEIERGDVAYQNQRLTLDSL
jgi:hypothetical protein